MPRVIFYTATTLNGFLADDDDSLDWLFAAPGGEGGDSDFMDFLSGIGVLVQGSATYEWVVRHEQLVEHPEKWPAYYGARPTFVFTGRELPNVPGADIRFVRGDVTDAWPSRCFGSPTSTQTMRPWPGISDQKSTPRTCLFTGLTFSPSGITSPWQNQTDFW